MPADPTAAHSDDRSRLCLTLTASAQPNGECGRAVRISRRSQHKPFAHPRDPSPRKKSATRPNAEPRTVHFPAPRHRRRSWKLMLTILVLLIGSVTILVVLLLVIVVDRHPPRASD